LGEVMKDLVMSVKQKLRPLIPDAVMARYRVRQHSLAMRTNVDVFLPNDREAKNWLRLTPDTYRVVTGMPDNGPAADIELVGESNDSLKNLIGFNGIEIAVAGDTLRPSMRGFRVIEPVVVPRTIVAVTDAFDEIGSTKENSTDLARTYQRLADTGRRIGLVPAVVDEFSAPDYTGISAPAAIVFAAVPLHDIGGGSRAAQITFELLHSGFHVTYVALYPSTEGIDLGLRYIHPMLEQHRIESFVVADIGERADGGIVILEAPAEPFVEPTKMLQERGWRVVYDNND
jgi:hypothetical protein